MTENDYLNSADIKEQCDKAIYRLERDNEALDTVERSLEAFINDDEIKSEAYDALKQQISDYKTLLRAMREANNSDAIDFAVLKASVGDYVLIGSNILAQKEAALKEKNLDESRAQDCEREASKAESSWISWYYNCKADHYWRMVDVDQELYNAWLAKEETFDAIEAKTKGLFQGSTMLRQAAQRGLEGITGAFQNGAYVPDASAAWRTELVQGYTDRLIVVDAEGNATIIWSEVEKVLQKDATEILDMEYQALAEVYLNADNEGMAKFLGCCMDRKKDVDRPWYSEMLGSGAGLVNQDYTEWMVNEKKFARIQNEIIAQEEEMLLAMKEEENSKSEEYQALKKKRNEALQRLTLINIVAELGTFRGNYQDKYPGILINTGAKQKLVLTFHEFKNVGSEYAPTISNLGESTVTVDYILNGDNIKMNVVEEAELAFKGYFCNYSVGNKTAKFVYDKTTGELISQGSEKAGKYVSKKLGKEVLENAFGVIPIVGDATMFAVEVCQDLDKEEKAYDFIKGQFYSVKCANIYSDYDCSINMVHYDTDENKEQVMYAYEGENTEKKIEQINALFQAEIGKRITKDEVFTNPNAVYDLYQELEEKNIDNSDRYEEIVSNK